MEDGSAARGGADQRGTPRNSDSREGNSGPRCVGSEPSVKCHTLEGDLVFPSGDMEHDSVARDGVCADRDRAEPHETQDPFDVSKQHDDCDCYECTNQVVIKYFCVYRRCCNGTTQDCYLHP